MALSVADFATVVYSAGKVFDGLSVGQLETENFLRSGKVNLGEAAAPGSGDPRAPDRPRTLTTRPRAGGPPQRCARLSRRPR